MMHVEHRPVPDPTLLTTEQLLRETKNAVALLRAEIEGDRDTSAVRFDGVTREFSMIEDRRKEQKIDTKTAVDAALQAAKEAMSKIEASTLDQAKQQNATFTANLQAVVNNVSDIKDRIGTIEASKIGAMEMKSGARLDLGVIFSLIAIAVVLFNLFVSFAK